MCSHHRSGEFKVRLSIGSPLKLAHSDHSGSWNTTETGARVTPEMCSIWLLDHSWSRKCGSCDILGHSWSRDSGYWYLDHSWSGHCGYPDTWVTPKVWNVVTATLGSLLKWGFWLLIFKSLLKWPLCLLWHLVYSWKRLMYHCRHKMKMKCHIAP